MRELWLHDDVVVQVLLQVLGALVAAMPIVHCEYLYLRPMRLLHFGLLADGLDDV